MLLFAKQGRKLLGNYVRTTTFQLTSSVLQIDHCMVNRYLCVSHYETDYANLLSPASTKHRLESEHLAALWSNEL